MVKRTHLNIHLAAQASTPYHACIPAAIAPLTAAPAALTAAGTPAAPALWRRAYVLLAATPTPLDSAIPDIHLAAVVLATMPFDPNPKAPSKSCGATSPTTAPAAAIVLNMVTTDF